MSNDDYNDPAAPTRIHTLQPVHPAVTREHKARLAEETRQAHAKDREFLDSLDHDDLIELAEAEGHLTTGSPEHLRARLMGDPEPSGPRFAP